MSWKGDAHYGGLYALSVLPTSAAAAGRRHRQLLFLFGSVLVAVAALAAAAAAVWILVPVFAFYRSVNDHIVYTGVRVCASVSMYVCVCMSCRKLTPPPPPGHSRRFCQARCDGFSLSLSLATQPLSFWLDVPLELLLKKTSFMLCCAVLRAGSGSPKVHFSSFLFRSAASTACFLFPRSLSLCLVLWSHARTAFRVTLWSCRSSVLLSRCVCSSCLYHPCHIPFP